MSETASESGSTTRVTVDASQRFQSVLGFGGAFTDASCYLLSRMDAEQRRKLLNEFFGQDGLGLSMGRTCMGASDYSRTAYSYDDATAPDPELKHFSIAHDRSYILPVLREALSVQPELFLFSTPWSPPGWMKAGGSLLGGSMRKQYFAAYAQYFVKFLEGYKAEGVPIRAVTTQNEVDTDQDGRMPAALWGQEYEMGFIKGFLGPALRSANLDTKVWLLDHNYDLWGRALDMLSDPEVFKYVDGVAWHGYVGEPDAMTRVHNSFPTKNAYWTEGGPDYTAPDYATDWAKWAGTYAQILKNWARCIVAWNLVLDEKGRPNIGPFNCGGMVTLDSKTQKLSRSGQYWAFAHYAKMVRRGAQVIATSSDDAGVEHVAFANPDSGNVLVLTNVGDERRVECRFEGRVLPLTLARNSVLTVTWN
ncbi:MAG TPA: glycoside hydrolase family 30 beta sandwich domain-containing protein [Terracidiphilus sp.]|nr:glycoside hydrolase family 30 beta sandwich domain-containing protein [Terracidiphilus sp.]